MSLATRPLATAVTSPQDSHKVYGIEYGVVSVRATDKGIIEVQLPRLPGQPVIPCRFTSMIAGKTRGFYWTPEPGDEVAVAFERGEQNRGVIIGCMWNEKDPSPKPTLTPDGEKPAWTEENTTRMIITNSGHKVVFNDKGGEEQIHIEDKSGKRFLTFDTVNKKIIIEEQEGDMEIKVKAKIAIECDTFELKAKTEIKMETKDMKVKTDSSTDVDGGSKIKMKAGRIDLN